MALTGDAAWCATPLAGMGATLAIMGGYVLAGELSRNDGVGQAFSSYERIMRPFVKKAQSLPRFVPRLLNPHSDIGIAALHGALRLATKPAIRNLAAKVFTRKSSEPQLPGY